jgi:hypothetical protein
MNRNNFYEVLVFRDLTSPRSPTVFGQGARNNVGWLPPIGGISRGRLRWRYPACGIRGSLFGEGIQSLETVGGRVDHGGVIWEWGAFWFACGADEGSWVSDLRVLGSGTVEKDYLLCRLGTTLVIVPAAWEVSAVGQGKADSSAVRAGDDFGNRASSPKVLGPWRGSGEAQSSTVPTGDDVWCCASNLGALPWAG